MSPYFAYFAQLQISDMKRSYAFVIIIENPYSDVVGSVTEKIKAPFLW